jgi:transcriptional regulator with XRE-family HTH domain
MKSSSYASRRDIVPGERPEKPRAYTGMPANTLPEPSETLGGFLRDRRARLAPPANAGRRRTPGLRREEVAARAGVSITWYTWLEQGRGGPPSDDVLERLARALELDAAGREMMFLIAQQRPPPLQAAPTAQVPPAIQLVLDAMPTSPAMVKTPTWDVVAWNAACAALLGGGPAAQPPSERNSLRRLFCDPAARAALPDWEEHARSMLAVFRIDVARMGRSPEAAALIAELEAASPEFRRLWAENDVRNPGVGVKRFDSPAVGSFSLSYASFAVDGAEGLTMIVFTPVAAADVRAIEALMARRSEAA